MEGHPAYRATCVRSGDWWSVEIADAEGNHIPGAVTQAKRLDQVEANVREVVSILMDVDEDTFTVALEPRLPAQAMALMEIASHLNAEADRLRKEATMATKRTVDALMGTGLSQRDAARLVGLSHQRVSQIRAQKRDLEPSSKGEET